MRDIAGPCAESGIEPAERENRENRPDGFIEELFQDTPKALKSPQLRRLAGNACWTGHRAILAETLQLPWPEGSTKGLWMDWRQRENARLVSNGNRA